VILKKLSQQLVSGISWKAALYSALVVFWVSIFTGTFLLLQ